MERPTMERPATEQPLMDFQRQEVYDTSVLAGLKEKTKKSPFLMAAVASIVTVCGVGIYKWRTRKLPMQLFLIQLRLAAQGAAVGCITLGMGYHMLQDFVFNKKPKPE